MLDLEAYRDVLKSILHEWSQAERDIKLAEQVSLRVVEPAIKELRYAGRRVTEALHLILSDGSDADIKKLLHDADFDCHRARHDAIDAATSKMAATIAAMVKSIGYDTILRVCPTFLDFYKDLSRVRKKIVNSRENRQNRDAIYESIESVDLQSLIDKFEDIMLSENIMLQSARKERRSKLLGPVDG